MQLSTTYEITRLTEVILYPLNFQLPSLLLAENRPATPIPIAHIGSEQITMKYTLVCLHHYNKYMSNSLYSLKEGRFTVTVGYQVVSPYVDIL